MADTVITDLLSGAVLIDSAGRVGMAYQRARAAEMHGRAIAA